MKNLQTLKKMFSHALLSIGIVMLVASVAVYGDIYTLDATLQGTVNNSDGVNLGDSTHTCGVGRLWSDPYHKSMIKFDIPVYTDQVITSVMLNVDATSYYNTENVSIQAIYVSDDSWNAGNLTYDWPVTGTAEYNRLQTAENGWTAPKGLVSTDITSWLSLSGEGQGATLSIQLIRVGSEATIAGALIAPVTLTIETSPIPEPTTVSLLLAGVGAIFLKRKV